MAPDLRVLDGIANWCGGLHGSMPLGGALGALAGGLGAVAAVIVRDSHVTGQRRIAAAFDQRHAVEPALRRSFAPDVLGAYHNKVRAGTLWLLSHREEDAVDGDALRHWRRGKGVADIAVITLRTSAQETDYLELHFEAELSRSEEGAIEAILPTLTRSWAGRKPGIVTEAQVDERILAARRRALATALPPDAPILGDDNPAKLSRAEFRVCLLLSRGLSVKGIIEELSLSEATVRTHLRNIYAKTGTSGQAELLYRILSAAPSTPGSTAIRRA